MKLKNVFETERDFAFDTDNIIESKQERLENKRYWKIAGLWIVLTTIANWIVICSMLSDCFHK